jgi:Glycosyltransferase family 92
MISRRALPANSSTANAAATNSGNLSAVSSSARAKHLSSNTVSATNMHSLMYRLVLSLLLLLMIIYIAVVVKLMLHHWPFAEEPSTQERWKEMTKDRTKDESKRRNPFHLHNLDAPLQHGVKPEVLLQVTDKDHVAMKDDIDLKDHPTPEYVLTAYLEPIRQEDWAIQPLPKRSTATAQQLTVVQYPRLFSCQKLPQQWPIDDSPVDADAFLPWIHDVFPTADGKYIQFVAQNKRRCKNGSQEKHILKQQQPQAALFQHVSLRQLTEEADPTASSNGGEPRFRLATHDDADPDKIATRFLCRFKPDGTVTTSVFNFDYDWTAVRKRYKNSFQEDDAGIKAIHTSQLIFRCPVPEHLQETIRTGASVSDKDYATLFVDLIPIRTPPRFGKPTRYLQPQYKALQEMGEEAFPAERVFGTQHVLPRIADSGRWENIPICRPSLMTYEGQTAADVMVAPNAQEKGAAVVPPPPAKKHRLVSCIWASAGYTTRGSRSAINDGQRRLLEWITYNSIIGFDHIYVYDNSGAFSEDISLKPVVDLFPSELVTYIPWPSQVCNNNPNNVDSVGERSSQYAAESSCRLRFGPHVDWIGQFDIDEYLVPMGEMKTITQLLDRLDAEDTRIISFASWRAWPRRAFIEPPVPITDGSLCWSNEPCFDLKIPYKFSMLQAYNCDRQKPGEKKDLMPAEKQLYRAEYVLQHFVHYSVATVLSEKNESEYVKEGFPWKGRAFPDPRQRFGDELKEGLMIHTKSVARQDTAGYERQCHINNTFLPRRRQGLCRLGLPYPHDWVPTGPNATKEGYAYNCYVNQQVEEYLIPLLNEKLKRTANFFDTS